MSRNCGEVIKQIIDVVPPDSYAKKLFIHVLQRCKIDASFKAPEDTVQWNRLHDVLTTHLGENPTEEWHWKIWSIFTTKSIEELKQLHQKHVEANGK